MEDIQHQQMGYDRAATMFTPDGHILQVEYAEKTIRLGSASIGMLCKDGVILVSDRKKKDKLVIENSANKVQEIDEHILVVSAGIGSDARVLIDKARVVAQQHRVTYDSPIPTEGVVNEIADIKQRFTHYGGGRPYGVSMMFAGVNGEPALYTTDVTGNYLKYRANAIGENDMKLKDKLRKEYKEDLTVKEGIKLALKIFKEILDDDFDTTRFDIGVVTKDKGIERPQAKDFI
jgi:proteasome alpha subunit